MKLYAVFFIVSVIVKEARYEEKVTLPIKQRINLLKHQIREQVEAVKSQRSHKVRFNDDLENFQPNLRAMDQRAGGGPDLVNANYDYVNLNDEPITPVMDFDHRKKDNRFRLRELRTTIRSTESILHTPYYFRPAAPAAPLPKRAPLRSVIKVNAVPRHDRPIDVFYRRQVDTSFYFTPMQWVHCEDLITPLLTGLKTQCLPPKLIESDHRLVTRLIQLITINTTHYAKEEIYSLLYQLSNLQIRLFQWSIKPMRLLFSTLSNGEKHTFKSLKYGVKRLFQRWHLDFSNITNLLKQSRLFRPYCINVGHHGGSTKSSKHTRYTKSTETTTKCTDSDDSAQAK